MLKISQHDQKNQCSIVGSQDASNEQKISTRKSCKFDLVEGTKCTNLLKFRFDWMQMLSCKIVKLNGKIDFLLFFFDVFLRWGWR